MGWWTVSMCGGYGGDGEEKELIADGEMRDGGRARLPANSSSLLMLPTSTITILILN